MSAPAAASLPALYSRLCAGLSRTAMALAIVGLLGLILCVQGQVIGRYLFNDTPTWAEALALLLVLYVTAFGVAVGVREAGHIGLESLVVLLPEPVQRVVALLVHALTALFGALMATAGWEWATLKWTEVKPMLGVPEGLDYLPLLLCGVLIVLFALEHAWALLRGERDEAAQGH